MKTINFKKVILMLILLAFFTGNTFAQRNQIKDDDKPFRGPGPEHFLKIPDLTDDQKEEIKKLKTEHMKSVLPLRNQLREKEAHLQTVSTGENVNMNEVNKTIDEIAAIKTQMAKKRAGHHQQIRNLLTEDQRVFFDSRPRGKGKGPGSCGKHPQGRMKNRERF